MEEAREDCEELLVRLVLLGRGMEFGLKRMAPFIVPRGEHGLGGAGCHMDAEKDAF